MDKLIEKAIRNKGFSVVEALSPCPTAFGRRNRLGNGSAMLRQLKEDSVSIAKAANMPEADLANKIVTGVLVDKDLPEYTENYQKLIDSFQK